MVLGINTIGVTSIGIKEDLKYRNSIKGWDSAEKKSNTRSKGGIKGMGSDKVIKGVENLEVGVIANDKDIINHEDGKIGWYGISEIDLSK